MIFCCLILFALPVLKVEKDKEGKEDILKAALKQQQQQEQQQQQTGQNLNNISERGME